MILWWVVLLIASTNINTKAEISIDSDGGYKNIVVGIYPKFNESDLESILSHLKALFRQTSEALFTASEKNLFFKDIVFALPKEYGTWISKTHFQIDGNAPEFFRKPNVYLTTNDVFGTPYTIQHRGCGNSGLRIHIPRDFLKLKEHKKSLELTRQWAHYRYGVFSENGFANDEIFPVCYKIPGSGEIKLNACTNDDAVYEIDENYLNSYATRSCNVVPDAKKNDHIISSIMTNINFPKMRYFCNDDARPHSRNSPTKQNALCREKSTWDVISANKDFKVKSKNASNFNPVFKYFVESHQNFVVAVDTSSEMDLNDRMIMTSNAFSYFMFYDVPYNSTVRLVDMKSKESTIVEKTILSEDDASRLIGLFPEIDPEGETCVHCTIQKLLEIMKLNVSDIIIITATDITSDWADNVIVMLKSNKVALHVIYFEKNLRHLAYLDIVAKSSGGSFYYIPESFPPGYPSSSITVLYEAFRSIYESFSWLNRQHVLVDQMTFTNNCKPKCILSFPTDSTIETLHVVLTGAEFSRNPPVVRKSIILENGKRQFISGNDSFVYKSEVPAYIITVTNPQGGNWNLTFERRPAFNKPIVAIVRAMSTNYGDIINMQSWISDNNTNVDNSDKPPILMFTELKKHNKAVIDTEVTALVHQTSYNTNSTVKLKDDGSLDPDITKNDGIYSRYLTDIPGPGYYSMTVVAEKKVLKYYKKTKEDRCCGSFIPDYLSYESGYFKRVSTYQSFFVGKEKTEITYAPRRIMDLRIDRIEILSNNVKCYILKWTAPGENCDKGKAFSYDIKVFKTRKDALNNFHNSDVLTIKMLNIQGPLLVPLEAGTSQTAYVELTNLTSGTYFMAIKTTGHSGKISDVSNVVELTYVEENTLVTGPGFSKDGYHTSPIGGTTEIVDVSNDTSSTNFGLAIGLTCGSLFLLLIIGLILLWYFGKKRKSKKEPNETICQNSKKTESSDALCHSNGGGNISIISPVTSWDANSLMSRFETLQQHKSTNANGMLTESESRETDNISLPSSKYSYDNKIENSSIYDPIYYHQVRTQDEMNYPYNPAYTPFHPMYASSMRRSDDSQTINNPYCSDNASYCSYSLPRNQPSRLKTDV